jgi:hypothetical protein
VSRKLVVGTFALFIAASSPREKQIMKELVTVGYR